MSHPFKKIFSMAVMPLVLSWCHAHTCTYILCLSVPLDCLSRFTRLFWQLPLSQYLAVMSLSASFLLTFLFSLMFPCSCCLSHLESPPFFLICVSHFLIYLLKLFCHLLNTILHISQHITILLTCLYQENTPWQIWANLEKFYQISSNIIHMQNLLILLICSNLEGSI